MQSYCLVDRKFIETSNTVLAECIVNFVRYTPERNTITNSCRPKICRLKDKEEHRHKKRIYTFA